MHKAITSTSYADVSKSLCGCMSPYISALPSCGDIGELKGNMTTYVPYCDVAAKCPSLDAVPVVEAAVKCYNQSSEELCANDAEHECLTAVKPLFESSYYQKALDCWRSLELDVKAMLPPGVQTNIDFNALVDGLSSRGGKVHYEDVKDGACYVANFTRNLILNTTGGGPACDDDKVARQKASAIGFNMNLCMSTPFLDATVDVPDALKVFVDHNDTDPMVKHVAHYLQQIVDAHPGIMGEECGCVHGAYQAYQDGGLDCGPFSAMHAGLHLASDVCSIVDNCPSVQPQTFLNVLKECKFGDAKKEPDTIVGQLCDPELERDATGDYNKCYQAIEAVFKQDIPISALKCLYHSQVDWPMLIDAAREYGGDAASNLPSDLNVTSMLEAALESAELLKFESIKNIVCAVAWEDPHADDDVSYDPDYDFSEYDDFSYGEEKSTSPTVLAGGGVIVLAIGFALYTMVCKKPLPSIETAADDDDDYKGRGDSKKLVDDDDDDII